MMAYPWRSSAARESKMWSVAGDRGRKLEVSSFISRVPLYRNPSHGSSVRRFGHGSECKRRARMPQPPAGEVLDELLTQLMVFVRPRTGRARLWTCGMPLGAGLCLLTTFRRTAEWSTEQGSHFSARMFPGSGWPVAVPDRESFGARGRSIGGEKTDQRSVPRAKRCARHCQRLLQSAGMASARDLRQETQHA